MLVCAFGASDSVAGYSGKFSMTASGGWGSFVSGNTIQDAPFIYARVSGGANFSIEPRLRVWRNFSLGLGVGYTGGYDEVPLYQAFLDDYHRGDFPPARLKCNLFSVYLAAGAAYNVGSFRILPKVGIAQLWGRAKFPFFDGEEVIPPNLPEAVETTFSSNDLGYLVSIEYSYSINQRIAVGTESGYRFFKLGIPDNKDGIEWTGSNLDFSGAYINASVCFIVF